MTANIRSGFIAGLIASVIWMIISTAVGMGRTPVIVGGLAFLFGTWLVTALIATIISRSKQSAATS